MILACGHGADLCGAREQLNAGSATAVDLLARSLDAAAAPAARHVFLRRFDILAQAQAQAIDALAAAGQPRPALAGLAVSVKDMFDVAGQPTTAGSVVLPEVACAEDATAVARLRAHGAALVGHTNQSEFAFSGVGLNPHHGTPANAATAAIDPVARIPGGSTSGGAVSVASGAAWAALGTDTGGSLRIPAALHGLVGFKCTQRMVPREGCLPLAPTLDTVGAITHSVRDAILLHEVLSARPLRRRPRPLTGWRLALPTHLMLDGVDAPVAAAFARAVDVLRQAGASIEEIRLDPLDELAALHADGGLAAAESWAWHRARLTRDEAHYDPRVAARIRRGQAMAAADHIDLVHARRRWVERVEATVEPYDALLSPTVPIVAPPLAPLLDDDALFFATNALLLRNPSVVNFLDGCAITLPCQAPDKLPVGLMLWAPAMADERLLGAALAVEAELARVARREA